MLLAAEIQELLAWEADLGRRLDGLPYEQQQTVVRDALEDRARVTGLVVAEVARREDVTVPAGDAEIRARVYTPFGSAPHGAFLHLHGGGFVGGSIDWMFNDAKCAHICASAGCVVVTVEYRLAPQHPYPTAPEDCYAALLWLGAHAAELGVDLSRIAVGGESAGGNLAAVTALVARDRKGPPIALQLLEVPVTDMSRSAESFASLEQFGTGYGLDRTSIESFQDAYLPNLDLRLEAYASPLQAADLRGLPRAHVLTAELDPLRDSGEAYARRLQDAGVMTTLHRYEGQTHGSSSLWQSWTPAALWMDEVVGAIRNVVSPPDISGSPGRPRSLPA